MAALGIDVERVLHGLESTHHAERATSRKYHLVASTQQLDVGEEAGSAFVAVVGYELAGKSLRCFLQAIKPSLIVDCDEPFDRHLLGQLLLDLVSALLENGPIELEVEEKTPKLKANHKVVGELLAPYLVHELCMVVVRKPDPVENIAREFVADYIFQVWRNESFAIEDDVYCNLVDEQ